VRESPLSLGAPRVWVSTDDGRGDQGWLSIDAERLLLDRMGVFFDRTPTFSCSKRPWMRTEPLVLDGASILSSRAPRPSGSKPFLSLP